MNRRSFLYSGAALGAVRPSLAATAKDGLLEKVSQAALAMQRHSWEQGILAQAFLDMGDRERLILMAKSAIVERAADGRLAAIGGGATDPAMGGTAYWRAGELTRDPQIEEAARGLLEFVLKKTPRAADGTCYHVFRSPESPHLVVIGLPVIDDCSGVRATANAREFLPKEQLSHFPRHTSKIIEVDHAESHALCRIRST